MISEFICINCPMGCTLSVETDGDKLLSVSGNQCKKGLEYAKFESLDPRRMVTGSILVRNGALPLVSVKTERAVPKGKCFEVMDALRNTEAFAPVGIGDVLIENVAGTGVNIVATKDILYRHL